MLVAYLCTEAELSLSTAGLYSSLTFALSLAGKLLWGLALDGPRRRLYALAACLLLTVGVALLVRPVWTRHPERHTVSIGLRPAQGHLQIASFAILYGLGYGSTFTLVQSRAAQVCDGRCFQL